MCHVINAEPAARLLIMNSSWEVNTNLQPFDLQVVKDEVEKGNNTKRTKLLWSAYIEAAKDHDLEHYKIVLMEHDKAIQDDADAKALAAQEKEEKKAAKEAAKEANKGKGKRKSAAAVTEGNDAEMEDAPEADEAPKKKTNKRKADGEGDNEKVCSTVGLPFQKLMMLTGREDSQNDQAQAQQQDS